MYGWINCCLESLIVKNYSQEFWLKIVREASCEGECFSGDFIRNVHYSDDITYRLLDACSRLLSISTHDLLVKFGRNFIAFVEEHGYHLTVSYQGKTLGEWLRNLNEPHRLLKSRFPNSNFPVFWCVSDPDDPTGNTFLLNYKSTRPFTGMVVGVVKQGALDYFGIEVEMETILNDVRPPGEETIVTWRVVNLGDANVHPQKRKKQGTTPVFETSNDMETSTLKQEAPSSEPAKCPFSTLAALNKSAVLPLETRCPHSNQTINPTPTKAKSGVGLNAQQLKRLFPFHFVINKDLKIIQTGGKLNQFITGKKGIVDDLLIGMSAKDLFIYTCPVHGKWEWETLTEIQDLVIEFSMKRKGRIGATSPIVSSKSKDIPLVGSVMVMDAGTEQHIDEDCALFMVSPEVNSIEELLKTDLHLSDIPRHSFQRDVIVLGDHLKSETQLGAKLDALSKRLEEEKRISTASLKTKRVFVRYVSHEIRTPLNITLLGVQFLERELQHLLPQNDTIADILQDVKSSCSVAVEILNDLLLYEKIENGILTLTMNELPAAKFARDTISSFKLQATSADIHFDVRNNIPENVILNIDQTKLSQVVRNLVSNALKFTPQGGKVTLACEVIRSDHDDYGVYFTGAIMRDGHYRSASIFSEAGLPGNVLGVLSSVRGMDTADPLLSISSNSSYQRPAKLSLSAPSLGEMSVNTSEGSMDVGDTYTQSDHSVVEEHEPMTLFRIAVTDTGPGISLEDQNNLFREFSQVKAETLQHGQGSGLGLWIARNIVKLHNGRIGVFSEGEGLGSKFIVDIPIHKISTFHIGSMRSTMADNTSVLSSAETSILTSSQGHLLHDDKLTLMEQVTTDNCNKYTYTQDNQGACVTTTSVRTSITAADELTSSIDPMDLQILKKSRSLSFPSPKLSRTTEQLLEQIHANSGKIDTSTILATIDTPSIDKEDIAAGLAKIPGIAVPAVSEFESLRGLKMLVVDDVAMNRKMVRRLLSSHITHIDEAENGKLAVEMFANSCAANDPYQIIMMDYFMPIMNGLEATSLIKKISKKNNTSTDSVNHNVLVIGVTGNGLKEDMDAFLASGADKVMVKPLLLDEFLHSALEFYTK